MSNGEAAKRSHEMKTDWYWHEGFGWQTYPPVGFTK